MCKKHFENILQILFISTSKDIDLAHDKNKLPNIFSILYLKTHLLSQSLVPGSYL